MPAFRRYDQLPQRRRRRRGRWHGRRLDGRAARRAQRTRVVLLEAEHARATAPAAAPRAWSAPRAAPRPRSASACAARTSTPPAATASRSTAGSSAQGYLMPCFTDAEVAQAHERIALQQSLGLDVEWLIRRRHRRPAPAWRPASTLGASYAPGDGYIDAPRNVLAYTAALTALRRRRPRTLRVHRAAHRGRPRGRRRHLRRPDRHRTGGADRRTRNSPRSAPARAAGSPPAAPGTRSSSPRPLPELDVDELPMVFDVTSGIYWRPGEAGGLLWGMSNPDEPPGVATDFDNAYYRTGARPDRELFPAVRARAATGVGGHDRLHAGPPADPRPAAHRRRTRSRAPSSPAPPATA